MQSNIWGTPEQIIEKVRERWKIIGPHDMTPVMSCANHSHAQAEAGIDLFSREVLPELQRMGAEALAGR